MQFKSYVLLLLFLLLLVPAINAADNPYQKIVVINLVYESGSVKEVSSEIQYGTPPNFAIQSGSIKGSLLDSWKNTINTFSIRDPRIQTGDSETTDTAGTPQGLAGAADFNPQSEFGIIVPFTPDLRYVTLTDSVTGNTLVTVDMAGALSAFRQMYPDDPDMKSIPEAAPAGPVPVPVALIAALGIALVIISGAAYFIRSGRIEPMQVMIVDDQQDILELFSLLLSTKGYVPVTAQSGSECLSILKTRKKLPDLILLDIMMFPMDGWQTLEEIKKNASWKKIPVLMLTAKQPTLAETKKYGLYIEDYLLKPVTPRELYRAIEYVMSRREFIEKEIHVAIKAGYEKELVCEYARLSKRVEVEKKLLGIVRTASATAESLQDGMIMAVDDVSAEIGSREERLRRLQYQLSPVLSPQSDKR
jgi:two-component system, OmpR family, response regulator